MFGFIESDCGHSHADREACRICFAQRLHLPVDDERGVEKAPPLAAMDFGDRHAYEPGVA